MMSKQDRRSVSETGLWILLMGGIAIGMALGLSISLVLIDKPAEGNATGTDGLNESELMCKVRTASNVCVDNKSVWHGCNMTTRTCGGRYVGS